MPIIRTKCYILSCEKYTIDSLYKEKIIYCSGRKCYQQSFDNTVTKFKQK